MEISWNKKINFNEALVCFLLDTTNDSFAKSPKSWIDKVIADGKIGAWGRIQENQKLAPIDDWIRKLNHRLQAVGLSNKSVLLGALWVRLIQESGLTLSTQAKQAQDHLLDSEDKDCFVLYQYRSGSSESGKFKGKKRSMHGVGNVIGFTFGELLQEQRKSPQNWPYCWMWRAKKFKSPNQSTATNMTHKDAPEEQSKVVPVKRSKRLKPVGTQSRKKRSLKELENQCGRRVVLAISECLEKESERKRREPLITLKGRNRRLYDSQRCLDDLVAKLKSRYPNIKQFADSTVKSALPHFVSCPRGRPGGLD